MATQNKTTFAVVGVNAAGPNSTSVGLRSLDQTDEIRYWAWLSNAVASAIVPGMRVTFDAVSFGKVQTNYVDKAGFVKENLFPKRQVFWGGKPLFDAPEADALPAQEEAVITDAARKFAENVRKSRENKVEVEGSLSEPF